MNIIVMTLGAMIAAFSLEGFLIPNKIIDGGILGIAIMTNYKTQFPLGWCIFILNLPFIFLALQKMGKAFVAFTFYAVTVLSIGVSLTCFRSVFGLYIRRLDTRCRSRAGVEKQLLFRRY